MLFGLLGFLELVLRRRSVVAQERRFALVLAVVALAMISRRAAAAILSAVELLRHTAFSNGRSLEGGWLGANAMLLLCVAGSLQERDGLSQV